ncbi:MAG: hypothetical protein DRP13_04395 [Candidatus Aenigmatarchaeota archaeon]|nr:MAG: hypothetical protein DRP13_04395 [Candidatus Aenigmarchaeota archaeon]
MWHSCYKNPLRTLQNSTQPLQCRVKGACIDKHRAHFILDIGLKSLPDIAKKLKAHSARHLLQEYPWLKKQHFRNSGLWNPSYCFDSFGKILTA